MILGAVQSLPSHLSKACAVAGGDTSEGLAQGARLGDGEAQTGDDCTCRCGFAMSMSTVGKQGMAQVILHSNATFNIECAADQGELQQMLTWEGEGCAALRLLHWWWPQSLPQQLTLSFSAADLLAGSSFANTTSFVGLECRITNRQYLMLLYI